MKFKVLQYFIFDCNYIRFKELDEPKIYYINLQDCWA